MYVPDEQNEDEAGHYFYAGGSDYCPHFWVLRPEHDDEACEMCGAER